MLTKVRSLMRTVPEEMVAKLRLASATFAAAGYDAARVEDLAQATGIPISTMYYYFAGKQELLAFLLRDYLDNVAAAVSVAVGASGGPPEQLVRLVHAHVSVMAAHPHTCQILLTELGRVGRLPDIAEAVQSAVHRPLQKILVHGVADGSFRAMDTENTTSIVYGAVTMTVLHHLVAGAAFEPDGLAEEIVGVALGGIRP
jgi:AcrR family transcriptional regulator